MRVLLVTHYFPEHRGGVEIIAGEIATRLAERGFEIVWAASGPVTERPGSRLTLLPMRSWNVTEERLGVPYPLWSPTSLVRLLAEVGRADVVHIHDCLYLGNVLAGLVGCARRKPLLVTQHVGLVPYSSSVLRGLMSLANRSVGRIVLGCATRSVFYSEKVQRYFAEFVGFRSEPAFISNGVSPDRFQPLSVEDRARLRNRLGWDGPVVLFVGRFVEKKGLALLRRLAQRIERCHFVLIGWGPERPEAWGLPQVECVGSLAQEDIVPYYQAADLLLLPSIGEGFPLVVQEAMACGTPVLISDDTAAGFERIREAAFVSRLDDAALEEALRSLLASPQLLLERRSVVADFARSHWSWETTVDRYQALLEQLSGLETVGR